MTDTDSTHQSWSKALDSDIARPPWVAEQLGLSRTAVYELLKTGQIPGALKIGRSWFVSKRAFRRVVHGEPDSI